MKEAFVIIGVVLGVCGVIFDNARIASAGVVALGLALIG